MNNFDYSIVICGEAGQGIQTVERLFTKILKKSCFNVFSTKEYMSRVRGGSNSTQIRISNEFVASYVERIDIFIPLHNNAFLHCKNRISDNTLIIGEKKFINTNKTPNILEIEFTDLALEIGDKIFSNIIAIGVLSSIFNIDKKIVTQVVKEYFSGKKIEIIKKNFIALEKGYLIGSDYVNKGLFKIDVSSNNCSGEGIILNGAEAVGFGALAGGCNFISSYPMSPSTGILTFLSKYSEYFDIVAEQAEDEISAINMSIGAWYSGARGMVTTSGGGYALMTEGISLAGMIESPVVVHLAQRPAPATGLPTRTEQGDLLHVVYSGHGEFGKIVFAPGTLQDGFFLTQKAFHLADKYQIPVYILTDQYFIDSIYNIPFLDLSDVRNKNFFVKTNKDYNRYEFAKNGISSRGIPGFGDGHVCVDSDEHDIQGRITEDRDIRISMVDKRLSKILEIKKEIMEPEFIGNMDYRFLVVGWGSTYHVVKEALDLIGRDDIGFLHFKQVYPIHSDTIDFLSRAEETLIVENNASSQFSKLIKLETGFEIDNNILQYDGLPFSVETIEKKVRKIFGGG